MSILTKPDVHSERDPSRLETRYEHIVLNRNRVPIIAGTTIKVSELVLEKMAYGWSPEELHFQHPYLTLGQIHSALAFYWDHQDEIDADIERRLEQIEQIRSSGLSVPLLDRLKAKGLIA